MIIKKTWFKKLFTLLFALFLMVSVLQNVSDARSRRSWDRRPPAGSIAEDKRPWAGFPWLVTGLLGTATFVVGLKNAKRSHLD